MSKLRKLIKDSIDVNMKEFNKENQDTKKFEKKTFDIIYMI